MIGLEDFVEGVRAMSGLPATTVTLSGNGEWYSERRRFDRVIAALGETVAREIVMEENTDISLRIQLRCPVLWRPSYDGLLVGSLSLPEDCLRVVGVHIEEWPEAVSRIILPGDGRHWQRYSEFSEIAGSPNRPKLYMVEGLGGKYIEIHKSKSGTDSGILTYIPCPVWEEDKMAFPSILQSRLISRVTEKVRGLLK